MMKASNHSGSGSGSGSAAGDHSGASGYGGKKGDGYSDGDGGGGGEDGLFNFNRFKELVIRERDVGERLKVCAVWVCVCV